MNKEEYAEWLFYNHIKFYNELIKLIKEGRLVPTDEEAKKIMLQNASTAYLEDTKQKVKEALTYPQRLEIKQL